MSAWEARGGCPKFFPYCSLRSRRYCCSRGVSFGEEAAKISGEASSPSLSDPWPIRVWLNFARRANNTASYARPFYTGDFCRATQCNYFCRAEVVATSTNRAYKPAAISLRF